MDLDIRLQTSTSSYNQSGSSKFHCQGVKDICEDLIFELFSIYFFESVCYSSVQQPHSVYKFKRSKSDFTKNYEGSFIHLIWDDLDRDPFVSRLFSVLVFGAKRAHFFLWFAELFLQLAEKTFDHNLIVMTGI